MSSFVELVPIILSQPGVSFFLSEKLCQDPLEKHFGLQRQRGKSNNNPMAHEVFSNTQALRVIGNINVGVITGNCRGKKELALQHLGKMMHLYRNANKNELKRSNALINLQYIVIMIYCTLLFKTIFFSKL